MSRELVLRHHELFPGSGAVGMAATRGNWRERPRLLLAAGAIVTAALVAVDFVSSGEQASMIEGVYTPLAAVFGWFVLQLASRRREPTALNLRTLAWTLALTGVGMLMLDAAPVIGNSAAVVSSNLLFAAGVARAMVIIIPALYRHLDRRALVMAGVDGAIMLTAGTTLLLTLGRTGRGGGADELFVPLMAATLLASSGMAAIAALTRRAAPGVQGVWSGIVGVFTVGLSWTLWIDLLMHGGLRNSAVCSLYAAGVLLLTFAWITWTDETGGGRTYERIAHALVDWLPILAIAVCVVVTIVPHGHVDGADLAPLGTAIVVLLSVARQRILIVRERWASLRLATELQERAQTMLSLARLERSDTLASTASQICAEALRLDGIEFAAVYVFSPIGGTLPLALAGAGRTSDVVNEPLDPQRSLHMRTCALTGAWVDASAPNTPTEGGCPLGEAFAPMRWDDRIVGVVAMGTTVAADASRLAERLPTLTEFGVVSAALLGPMLTEHWRLDDIRGQLNSIIAEHAFLPVFQPVVQLRTKEVVGFEALTRFTDGTRPDQRFIEADTAGMSVKLEMACLGEQIEAASWLPPGPWVSLNVSPALASAVVPLIAALERSDRDVVLEITEHVEISDYRQLVGALELVRTRVRLAVDDAGAGYAGLRHILELRPQFVKLDLSLVRHVDTDPAQQAMVAGMAHFARNSGCELIAEGIETEGELHELIRLGISLGQGYFFGKPGPILAD